MKLPPTKTLYQQILISIIGIFMAIMGLKGIYDFFEYRRIMLRISEEKFNLTNKAMVDVVEVLMLNNHSGEVAPLLERMQTIEGVKNFEIIKLDGRRAFYHPPDSSETPIVIPSDNNFFIQVLNRLEPVSFKRGKGVVKTITYLSPILNRPPCQRCHDPAQKVNGVLEISFSTAPMEKALERHFGHTVGWFLGTIIIFCIALFMVLHKIVKQPLSNIVKTIRSITAGNLSRRIGPQRQNEIGELAVAFNQMTDELEKSKDRLQERAAVLEQKVKERTAELEERVSDLNKAHRALENLLEDTTVAKSQAEASRASALKHARRLEALNEATQALITSLSFNEVAQTCTRLARELAEVDGATLYLVNEEQKLLEPKIAYIDKYRSEVLSMPLRFGEGITGSVAQSGVAEFVNRIDLTDRGKQVPGTPIEPQSILCAPLTTNGKVIGVLTLSRFGERKFDHDDLVFVENLTNISTVAMEKAHLYESVLKSESDYRALIESAVEAVIVLDEKSRIMIWNKAATRTFGYTEKEMLGQSVRKLLISDEIFKRHTKEVEQFLKTGKSKFLGELIEGCMQHKDGRLVDVMFSLSALQTPQGWRFTAFVRDITEMKRMRREVDRLADFPRENPLPVVEMNVEGKLLYLNPAGDALLKRLHLTRKEIDQILPENYRQLIKSALEQGVDISAQEVTLEDMDLLWTGHPLKDIGLIHFYATDITELKRIQRDLIEARERAEISDRLKNAFLGTISHEVRTPLNVILGYSDLLVSTSEDRLSAEEREFLQAIKDSGERLKHLIDDLLDISLIEADKTVLNRVPLLGDEIVQKAVREIQLAARKKNLKVECRLQANKAEIFVDGPRFQQALGNILQNAVKFTREGSITITTKVKEDLYQVAVKDTGIGIREDFKPYLFTLFRQAEEGYGRSFEGAGLGLSISHRLIEAMDGHIEVESQEGEGSTFTVSVPVFTKEPQLSQTKESWTEKVDKGSKKVEPGQVTVPKEKPHIFVLEDNPANQRYIAFLLKKLGYTTKVAAHAEKALEILKTEHVDCLLVDISLAEGMSGVDFLKAIRKKPSFDQVPIVAVTAHAMRGQKEQYLKAGFDDYLAKPFTLRELDDLLKRVLKSGEKSGEKKGSNN